MIYVIGPSWTDNDEGLARPKAGQELPRPLANLSLAAFPWPLAGPSLTRPMTGPPSLGQLSAQASLGQWPAEPFLGHWPAQASPG